MLLANDSGSPLEIRAGEAPPGRLAGPPPSSPPDLEAAGVSDTVPPADRYEGLETFGTPEEAALAARRSTLTAHARVVEVAPATEFVGVCVKVRTGGHRGFHDRDIPSCVQTPGGRGFEVSGGS